MEAWKFLKDDNRSGYGYEGPWRVGEIRTYKGEIIPCERGYHASPTPSAALRFAQGGKLARVRLSGKTLTRGDDKLCAETIEILEIRDVTAVLHEFACLCAEAALGFAGVEDERSWAAIEAKRAWIRGEIGEAELNIALAASDAAAWAAARAARAAVWAATLSPAMAADAAARPAARAAAALAADAAAADAAAAWELFDLMIQEAFEGKEPK